MSNDTTPGIGDNQPLPTPVLPGALLQAECLDPHGVSAGDLDERLDLPEGTTLSIIEGRRRITGWMSQLLARPFGLPDAYFSHLQQQYDDDAAAIDEEEEHESDHRMALADTLGQELRRVVRPRA